jgi:hypothetical protein
VKYESLERKAMKIKLNKIICIPVALMMLLAVTVVPTMACSPLVPCGSESGNSALNFSNTTINSINVEKMSGIQGKSLIDDSINSPEVLNVGQKLTELGYQQQLLQAAPFSISITNNTSEMLINEVIIPVKTGNSMITANTIVLKMDNQTAVYTQISGTGKNFPNILSLIKHNSSYIKHINELEKYGYKVDESNATINRLLNTNEDIAFITLTAKNTTTSENIYGMVNVKNGQVIAMSNNYACYACQIIGQMALGLGAGVTCTLTCAPYCLSLGPDIFAVGCGVIVALMCSGAGIYLLDTEGVWQVCHDNGWGC